MIPKIEFEVYNQGDNPKAYDWCRNFIDKWQKILNIQDWDIDLKFISGQKTTAEMGSSDYVAFCATEIHNKEATICMNIEHSKINDDIQTTLIHELMHIVMREWQLFTENAIEDEYAKEACRLKMEQTIQSLAKAFCKVGGEVAE